MRTQPQTVTPPPAPPAVPSPSAAYRRWAMTSIVLGGFISVLTYHVVNMVIPKMMSDLGADVVTIRWVITAYMLANAVGMPLAGWLARTLGARKLYIACLITFLSSTVACGMADSMPLLVGLRAIQGMGGGLIMPVTMLLMLDLYPPAQRGLGTAIWSMGASCGSLAGIPLGGFVAEHLSWRATFYLTLPPGLVALGIAYFIMHQSPRERGLPFDWGGFCTLGTAMVALLLALSNGQREGWDSTPIVVLLTVFGVAMVAFLLIEPHAQMPLIDFRTLRSPQYCIALGLSLLAGAMFNGGPFLLSLFLQQMYDFSVQDAALIMFPSSAFLVVCTPLAGWASDRIDARYLMTLGYLCYTVFGVLMMFADLRLSAFALLLIYFGRGLGLGLSYPVIYPIGISGLDPARGKAATTVLNLCVTLGGAVNITLLATILEQRHHIRHALLAETQTFAAVGTQQALRTLEVLAAQLGGGLPPDVHAQVLLGRLIEREALLLAFNDAFGTFALISLCGLALGLFFHHAPPPHIG
jgi:MFS transporter, DHA2 family, multidrug resistance protein